MIESNKAFTAMEETMDEEEGILLEEQNGKATKKKNGYGAVSTSET